MSSKSTSTFNFDFKRRSLIEYMRVKIDEADWHGVSDAANDLRVLEATQTEGDRMRATISEFKKEVVPLKSVSYDLEEDRIK